MVITTAVIATGIQVFFAIRIGISTFRMVNTTLKKRSDKNIKEAKILKGR